MGGKPSGRAGRLTLESLPPSLAEGAGCGGCGLAGRACGLSSLATSRESWLPALCVSGAAGLGRYCWPIPASPFCIPHCVSRGCSDDDHSGGSQAGGWSPGLQNRRSAGPCSPRARSGAPCSFRCCGQPSGSSAQSLPLPAHGPSLRLAPFSSGHQSPWVRSPACSGVTPSNLVTTRSGSPVLGGRLAKPRPRSSALHRRWLQAGPPGLAACRGTQAGPVCVRRGRQMTEVLCASSRCSRHPNHSRHQCPSVLLPVLNLPAPLPTHGEFCCSPESGILSPDLNAQWTQYFLLR
ncbi:unnamed protein product [Rangifer tarandus platyrhynchus]|uniref:Uncharacterized protein n=1 Tax=Rangifer tarandus platyrhynchus TaxID=3082113 RepID=A0ABN8ZYE0_RANTA|nr:unnamed protein product [Rangifer tarandus platyrhynchus]